MGLFTVFGVIYFTAVCAAQDPQHVTVLRESPSSVPPTVISTAYESAVPSLQLQSRWSEVFPSEKVNFKCTVDGSADWSIIWQRNKEQLKDSDPNVSVSPDGSILTITAANPTYSGGYSCKGQHKTRGITTLDSNSLQLKVHPNKPIPSVIKKPDFDNMFPGESVNFTCAVKLSSGWEYLWFHEGKQIQASDSHSITSIAHQHNGSYHCQAKRGQFFADSKTITLQVSDPPKPTMQLQTHWLNVFEEEVVAFKCEFNLPDWTFSWYKDSQKVQHDSELIVDDEGSLLNITSATKIDQGIYACQAQLDTRGIQSVLSNNMTVTFHDNPPKPTLQKVPGFDPMYAGENVTFTCHVHVSFGWEYQWIKDGNDQSATSQTNSFRVGLSDVGGYQCKATRGETTSTDNSDEMKLHVLEIPVPSLTPMTPWLDVFPGESVQLKCGMESGSGWTYTWQRDGRDIQADDAVSFDSNRAILYIKSASAAHKGQYKCRGHLRERSVSSSSSPGQTLTVYGNKPSVILTQDPDYKVMFSSESVSFSCHLDVSSGWEYTWYKDEQPLTISGNKYQINPLSTTNMGSYKCRAMRGKNKSFLTDFSNAIGLEVKENRPKPLMMQKPNYEKMYIGESVSFECKVELSFGWMYRWYKDNAQLPISWSGSAFVANLSDSGIYKCMAIREKTQYETEDSDIRTLHITEIPVPSTKLKTPWLDVFPTESVNLTCGIDGSSDWMYTWYKDNQMVQADKTTSFHLDGTILQIKSSSVSHRGRYSCSGKLKSRSVSSRASSGQTLHVYDTKPRLTLTQKPVYNKMYTGDSVSFSCHINISTGWEYWLYRDKTLVQSGNNHTITSVAMKNTGSYQCKAQRGKDFLSDPSQAVSLEILERPQANIILLTGWSEVFSTDSLVLSCEVQGNYNSWNYTWFKGEKQINKPPSVRYTVTPQDDPEQSQYRCQGTRDGRPSYSKISELLMTKNLLLKRRVLLSISGCLFFGIIVVFLGCIFLKVIRKPAADDYRLEEEDLFVPMNQQNVADIPCPLVEFITDATLKASSKEEGDENGTICSETTPLPITPQEDQAATTDSPDTTENNGGLVSFKQ